MELADAAQAPSLPLLWLGSVLTSFTKSSAQWAASQTFAGAIDMPISCEKAKEAPSSLLPRWTQRQPWRASRWQLRRNLGLVQAERALSRSHDRERLRHQLLMEHRSPRSEIRWCDSARNDALVVARSSRVCRRQGPSRTSLQRAGQYADQLEEGLDRQDMETEITG